jgi:hypothetical protein
MSTKVSTAYDNLLTRLAAVFTSGSGWLQIPNGFDVPSNANGFLRQGYGLAIGQGVNKNRELSLQISIDRTFVVSISREVFKTDGDASGYGTVAKQLMEDLFSLVADFEKNTTLNTGQIFCHYESDNGIQPIENGDFSGVYVSATFTVALFEDIN